MARMARGPRRCPRGTPPRRPAGRTCRARPRAPGRRAPAPARGRPPRDAFEGAIARRGGEQDPAAHEEDVVGRALGEMSLRVEHERLVRAGPHGFQACEQPVQVVQALDARVDDVGRRLPGGSDDDRPRRPPRARRRGGAPPPQSWSAAVHDRGSRPRSPSPRVTSRRR